MGLSLMQARDEVTGMLRSGAEFDAIEDQIETIPGLVADERAALWLYAWSWQDRRWQRRTAAQLLHRATRTPAS
jgi:hypothetical protein